MPLSEQQHRLASSIDRHVKQITARGGGDEELLVSLHGYMGTFKQIMDSSSPQEMQQLCQEYDGFYQFAQMLENLAQGIADGTIAVPTP